MSGLFSFIPLSAPSTGFIVAAIVAVVQFWPDWTVDGPGGRRVFVIGQLLEGNVLSPHLVGATVGLHPVWLMFALLAFGSLFGFVGLLHCRSGRRRDRRAGALCAPQIPG